MPFGLVNAAATFNRMMRKLLNNVPAVDSYIDDLLVHTHSWDYHLNVLREIFSRLRNAGLTIRPTKCHFGYKSLDFLGHKVSEGFIQPNSDRISAIRDAKRPVTKTQVRSFIGTVNYYRMYVPNFAAIATPITDLTKKGQPNNVSWGSAQEKAFQSLKRAMINDPILRLPDFQKTFVLRTDASDTGVGAVLLQNHNDELFPVAFASKKLLKREQAYSVIEKECLAVIWAVQKFQTYLYGKEFVLQTDHQPLIYLNRSKVANGRLMRWALCLQNYRFRIEAIKGVDNVGADYLSRSV
jgi:hypothetical protein